MDGQRHRLALPLYADLHRAVGVGRSYGADHGAGGVHMLSAHGSNNVTALQAALSGRAVAVHFRHAGAVAGGNIFQRGAQPAPVNAPVTLQSVDDGDDNFRGDGKPQPHGHRLGRQWRYSAQ